MTTEKLEITAKDDESSDSNNKGDEDRKVAAVREESSDDDDDDNKGNAASMDPFMNASNVINSMRTVIEDRIRNIEPPMPFFTRPKLRQHWGDVQVVPHKEWGDIFFDLFYVAGAYNLGTLLREEPTNRGLYYFCACFFPIQCLWQYKMYWDSRFYTPTRDMYHAFYELCTLVVLATAVLHIRPVALLSNPEEHIDLFLYCLAICIGMILLMGRSLEVVVLIEGEPAAVIACKRDSFSYLMMIGFFAAAAIYAGVKYYGGSGNDGGYDSASSASSSYGEESAYDSYNKTSDGYSDYNSTSDSEYHAEEHHERWFRFLAGSSSYGSDGTENNYSGDLAMGLLLGGYCANHLVWYLVMIFVIPYQNDGDYTRASVPMNVDYAIHRYGEWIMLMLGETVLSLLIVGVYPESRYYTIFYCGILTISLLQFMHFRSQPHHADDHAMRRKKERGYAFVILIQLYSAALIILGASYKMLLYEFVYEADYGAAAGYVTESDYGIDDAAYGADTGNGNETAYESTYEDDGHRRLLVFGTKLHRLLAGGGGGALRFDKEDREQRVAHLFCGSMAAVWFLNDLMILVHRGIKENMERCKEKPAPTLIKLLGIPLLLARVGLVVFMATLSQYATDPSLIAFVGLFGVVAQVTLRVVGTFLYHEDTEEDEAYQDILKHGLSGEQSMAFQAE